MKKTLLFGLLTISSFAFAQENTFKIQFKNTEKTIRMICLDKCDWFELEFKTTDFNAPKYFNEKGETSSNSDSQYLFSIEKNEDETFILKGLKNTEWQEYKFKTKGFWTNFLLTDQTLQSL